MASCPSCGTAAPYAFKHHVVVRNAYRDPVTCLECKGRFIPSYWNSVLLGILAVVVGVTAALLVEVPFAQRFSDSTNQLLFFAVFLSATTLLDYFCWERFVRLVPAGKDRQ